MNNKRSLRSVVALLTLCALPFGAHGISRWGNGSRIASAELGFSAEIPESVIQTREMSAKKLALNFGNALQFLVVGELSEDYPEYRKMNAQQIKTALQSLNPDWVEVSGAKNAMTLIARGPTATTALILWGHGKGVVLTGPKGAAIDESINKIVGSARIDGTR